MTAASRDLDTVRSEVRALLARSEAFQALPPAERVRLAGHMVKVGSYLADQDWLARSKGIPVARGLKDAPPDPVDSLKARLAGQQKLVGAEFKAGGVREGVEQFGEMVKKVDFPKFVAGLIDGVFKAVVDASIQQMQAFSELLSVTSKTVDEFAGDNITDGQARDYLVSRHPSSLEVDTSGDSARLRQRGEGDLDIGAQYGLSGASVDDEDSERALVGAAKRDMARQKQQMLATMMLMGINRIVVTNGHINAKVVFDMRASDAARRRAKAEMHDQEKDSEASQTGWLTNLVGGYDVSRQHETTVGSSVDENSQAKAEVKAQLTGDVKLAFKSETFPLERMVDVLGMQQLGEKAQPVPTRRAGPAAAVAPAAAPAVAAPAGGGK